MQRPRLYSALVALMFTVSLSACGGSSTSSKSWPDVSMADATGAELRSSAVLVPGRPSVISIWGVTCAACRQELPRLAELASANSAVDVAAINYGDEPSSIAQYLEDLGLSLRVFIDDEARLTEALGVVSLPATIFVRADGHIDDLHFGELSASQLEAGVAKLLAG